MDVVTVERERIDERRKRESFMSALQAIARGRGDCGRPLSGEKARQIARKVLAESGYGWK